MVWIRLELQYIVTATSVAVFFATHIADVVRSIALRLIALRLISMRVAIITRCWR
jgi:hypothetical protein